MGTKTITATNEAYDRLTAFKESKESFSDVINKITMRYSILDLVGVLSKDEADELKNNIKGLRKRLRKEIDKTALKLK